MYGARSGFRFIDRNPVTEAYQAGQRFANEQETHELSQEFDAQRLAEQQLAAPARIRSVNAAADMSESNARVQVGTEGNQIESSGIGLDIDRIDRDVARATQNDKVSQAKIATRQQQQTLDQGAQLFPGQLDQQRLANQETQQTVSQNAALFPGQLQQQAVNIDKGNIELEKARAWKENEFLDMAIENPQTAIMWARANGLEVTPDMEALVQDRNLLAIAAGVRDKLKEKHGDDIVALDREFNSVMDKMFSDPTPTEAEAQQLIVQSKEVPRAGTGGISAQDQRLLNTIEDRYSDVDGTPDYEAVAEHLHQMGRDDLVRVLQPQGFNPNAVDVGSPEWREAKARAVAWAASQAGTFSTDASDFKDYGGSRDQAMQQKAIEFYRQLKGRAPAPGPAAQPAPQAPAPQVAAQATPVSAAPSARAPAGQPMQPNEQHINYLRQNPGMAAQFDQKFGQGAAQRYLQTGR